VTTLALVSDLCHAPRMDSNRKNDLNKHWSAETTKHDKRPEKLIEAESTDPQKQKIRRKPEDLSKADLPIVRDTE
jgi:hypothetical protein